MGIRNPETDMFPYCEGSLKHLMETFGKEPSIEEPYQDYEPVYEGPDKYGRTEPMDYVEPAYEQRACVGCLNNGMCDPGECKDCKDCIGHDFTQSNTGYAEPTVTSGGGGGY